MLSWEQTAALAAMRCERAWVEIDLAALAHNVQQIKSLLAPQTQLMTVVKADAYGHGACTVARTALQAGASWLGVATIPEGIELRQAGIKAPILILGATNTAEQIRAIAQWELQPTLCTPQQALIYSETLTSLNQTLPVHIKIDTGMSRLGTNWQEAADFVQLVYHCPNLEIASIYSHLATADSPDPTIMKEQQRRFEEAKKAIRLTARYAIATRLTGTKINNLGRQFPRLHLANTAATLTSRNLHYDMVRVGLATYGLYPANHLKQVVELKPVMQVKAIVTQVKTIAAGTGVSYGYQFIADREMRLAVVGIGYADGIPRNLSNKMKVLIRGQQVPQVGAITMDQIMIDVSAIPDLQVGEVVTVLGKDGDLQIGADDWAEILGTISWEILCSFKHRLPRVAIGESKRQKVEGRR
ncbi:alanine racemase [Floridanema evergladense]|uniref:Alanine racemase n=1 Tax=Floridaenema evergladense BLCC-F167 TaxID=3153639 RepID=A0ABV4WPX5_9CYAN